MVDYSLYLATDRQLLRQADLCDAVREAVDGGVTVVQLREKNLSSRAFYAQARDLLPVTRRLGVPLIINDRVDIMLAVGAEGVHLGPYDLPVAAARELAPGKIIGASVNSLTDLRRAEAAGVDYVGVGPVYATGTKSDLREVLGPDGLQRIVTHARVPCVAVGGINASRLAEVMAQAVDGVCVISAVIGAENVRHAASRLTAEIARIRGVG